MLNIKRIVATIERRESRIRAIKVQQIRNKISKGSYSVDSEALAKAMALMPPQG